MAEFDTETRDRLEACWSAALDLTRELAILLGKPLTSTLESTVDDAAVESVPMRPGRSMDKETAMRERAERKEQELLARSAAVAEENQRG